MNSVALIKLFIFHISFVPDVVAIVGFNKLQFIVIASHNDVAGIRIIESVAMLILMLFRCRYLKLVIRLFLIASHITGC